MSLWPPDLEFNPSILDFPRCIFGIWNLEFWNFPHVFFGIWNLPFWNLTMYSPIRLALKYLKYWITAKNGKGHGIHSPFVFDLVVSVLNDKGNYYCYEPIEALRKDMLQKDEWVTILDLGAGSRKGTSDQRKVSAIAKTALKPRKYSQLLFRLANYFKSGTILELGTSLGITTCYLASVQHNVRVITMEGVPGIAAKAQDNFRRMGFENIQFIEGNFDNTLPPVLKATSKVDFAYIDGNHRYEPTVRYFEQIFPHLQPGSCVVLDDIHWSREMEAAWNKVKVDKRVILTIDLFFIGLVFINPDIKTKQDFIIRF
jgi:predicted O-methyltransferase YrrM